MRKWGGEGGQRERRVSRGRAGEAKQKENAAAGPSRAAKKEKRATKGGSRYTPCLNCIRSALTRSRGHCHDTSLEGYSRCFECVAGNHVFVNPFPLLLAES